MFAGQESRHSRVLSSLVQIAQNVTMASDSKTVTFIVDQTSGAGDVRAKPMFGEYGIYCDGKMVAMICDDQLFVKPTPAGRSIARNVGEAPPYPGAKPCLLIDAEYWDDRDWLTELSACPQLLFPIPNPAPSGQVQQRPSEVNKYSIEVRVDTHEHSGSLLQR